MFTRSSLVLEKVYRQSTSIRRFCSTISEAEAQPDPRKIFFHVDVQLLLKTLTRVDYEKVFQPRKVGKPLKNSIMKFLTTEQLKEYERRTDSKAFIRLQMPPVVEAQEDTVKLIGEDPGLRGLTTAKHVFTDISFGISNKNRLIVVREPDGKLRHAFMNERSRMNQVYFPVYGKEIETPKMFFDPHLENLLEREEYVFILDRACIQFEPNDPEYHRVTKRVYEDVNLKRNFESLRSTRHFGPLAFHLAWEKKIDNLLVDVIHSQRIDEAVALIKLYHIFHPQALSAQSAPCEDDITMIKSYAKLESSMRRDIDHALLKYEKLEREIQKFEAEKLKLQDSSVSTEEDHPDEPKQDQ
nr:28S ribosomal protein S22, mitochondrial [Megalopta genalis]